MNYTKIKTWAQACKVHGYDPKALPEVKHLPKKFQDWIIATYKMGVITEAINTKEDGTIWIPDWNNRDQIKYTAWFQIKATKNNPSGVGFSDSGYDYWFTGTGCGSRLCFETRDQVYHVQKHFEDIFLKIHLIK